MKINTGFPFFNSPSDPQGTENQSPNVIFNANSQSLTSHIIDVSETVVVVKAYGLTDGNTITVYTVSTSNLGTFSAPLIINGRTVQLAETSNTLVIDISGKYKFVLDSGLGTVNCVYHDSGLSMFSFGLATYATVDANLEFIETATVLPAVSGIEVRENVKLSAADGNLLQVRSDGLYYGIAPPPNFASQYISSSTGNDSNPGTIGSPLQTIQKAISNLPDGTAGSFFLLAGDTFHTYPTASTDVITTLTQQQALNFTTTLNIGNRQITIVPYNDPAIDAINAYNLAHGTVYVPYIAAEINFPTIKATLALPTDAATYVTIAFSIGTLGLLSFRGINFTVGQTGTVNPGYYFGAFVGTGRLGFQGGNIIVGSVPLIGDNAGTATFTFSESFVVFADHGTPSTPPYFCQIGSQFFINTIPAEAGGGLVVPALTYTVNADNAETYLATAALWHGITIYSTSFRSFSKVISTIAIA